MEEMKFGFSLDEVIGRVNTCSSEQRIDMLSFIPEESNQCIELRTDFSGYRCLARLPN